MTVWFTADPHIGHAKIIEHCARPFESVEAMDELILTLWQAQLEPGDRLYILGDLSLKRRYINKALDRIPPGVQVFHIFGNHDHRNAIDAHPRVVWSGDLKTIKVQDQHIVLCHYPMRAWDGSHRGSWQLYGHTHGNLPPEGAQLDVGVDNVYKLLGTFGPLAYESVKSIIERKLRASGLPVVTEEQAEAIRKAMDLGEE